MRFIWWDFAGIGLVLLSWTLLLVGMIVTHDFVMVAWFADREYGGDWKLSTTGTWLWRVYRLIAFLTVASQVRAMLADPGIMRGVTSEKAKRKCEKCTAWKPARAHHCSICGDCIFRMDHHCPWVNNCVGYGNLKFFILYTGYSTLLSCYTLVLLGVGSVLWWRLGLPVNTIAAVAGVTVALEATFLCWFAGDFFAEQLEAIETNTTLVETYKDTQGANIRTTTFFQRFVDIFGEHALLWPLPIATTRQPPDYFEGVLKEFNKQPLISVSSGKGLAEVADEPEKVKLS